MSEKVHRIEAPADAPPTERWRDIAASAKNTSIALDKLADSIERLRAEIRKLRKAAKQAKTGEQSH